MWIWDIIINLGGLGVVIVWIIICVVIAISEYFIKKGEKHC